MQLFTSLLGAAACKVSSTLVGALLGAFGAGILEGLYLKLGRKLFVVLQITIETLNLI